MPELSLNQQRVWYRTADDPRDSLRTPVLLIHGAGSSSIVWLYQLRALRRIAPCIAPDLPGHGRSDDDANCSTIAAHASFIGDFLDALHIPRCIVVGHSMGGAIATHFALHNPKRCAALIAISSGATIPVSHLVLEALQKPPNLWLRMMEDLLYSPATPQRFVDKSTPTSTLDTAPHVLRRDFEACRDFDLSPHVAMIQTPSLIIAGRDDAMVPTPLSQALAQTIPNARLEVIAEAGHMVLLEQHKKLNDILTPFIEQLDVSA